MKLKINADAQAFLDGAHGRAARTSMEILVALARIYEARELIPVASVQVAGVSYHNLGEAGLDYLADLATDGEVRVPTRLNPAGMDLERWREMGIDADFAGQQQRVIEAFVRMGVSPSCTCTPYLAGLRPEAGQHLAWAESSAVTYANSVLGARSNREGGPSALAAALTGRTPAYGLHLDEHRQPSLRVELSDPLRGARDFGLLGALIGKRASGALPWITGLQVHNDAELKALCAALPTFGAQPMFHIDGHSPEAASCRRPETTLRLGRDDIEATAAELGEGGSELDLVALGCPHFSLDELAQVAALVDGRSVKRPLWISTSRAVVELARKSDLYARVEASGARIWADTCFAVAPLKGRFTFVATNSAKGCFYGHGHNRFTMRVGDVERCVRAALAGEWR